MSQRAEIGSQRSTLGLEALRQSPDFHGPVEPLDEHEYANDHLALIYESREEQFAAAIPFIRQGLELGERCVYITEENPRELVIEEMRARGIDVDAALESGALSIHTEEETYLRNGWFDPDDTISFLDETIAKANEEFEGLRVTGEMNWAMGDDCEAEDLVKCEAKANYLFDDVDGMALCQFNRNRFPAEVIRDVISTHPHLVHGNRISHNSYYTPPTEFFGPERPEREVDRMLGTLREQTDAKAALEEREQYLREQNEITADPNRSFEEKLHAVFELGCEQFDLELGATARVDRETDRFEVEYVSGDHEQFQPGMQLPLSETYCTAAAENDGVVSVADPVAEGYDALTVRRNFGFESYLGICIEIDGGPDRTFFFVDSEPRDRAFSSNERTFHRLMGQWIKYELEREQRERDLEQTVDQLQQSNDRLKQFAYAASHDLQEPLRMVSSYLQLLEEQYGDELDETADEYIEFAVDGADRMRAMVDDLLAYSRVEQSDGTFEPVDFEGVIDRVTNDLRVKIEETDAEITVESLPTVMADSEQLEQLFSNLVSNALKYSGDSRPEIEIGVEERLTSWEFSVADNGIGIDPEKTDRIFEVFKRLHHDDEYPGTGIGLSLCQEIVENHDGEIRVESEPGEGSTFFVTLPKRTQSDGKQGLHF